MVIIYFALIISRVYSAFGVIIAITARVRLKIYNYSPFNNVWVGG
jgi:hypothetical protein